MRVRIDADLCTACELCSDSVPDVFSPGDDVIEAVVSEVPENLEDDVQEAANDCPVEAIIIE